ncbi:helix-turn-helix domain-containing protein [Kitasatospora sp. NPDC056181]|uniref:helix-turn-helix domain-containing protein n=1 Tax=Kitasatospora sp. NPDC056181 TaxID=3345737 RepID=UPI0035D68BE3
MPPQADGLQRLAGAVQRRRAELRLSKDECARRASMSITTWRRVEDGDPVRDTTYARVDEVLGWELGASARIIDDPTAEPMLSEVHGGVRYSQPAISEDRLRHAIQNATIATAPTLTGAQIKELQERAIEELRRQGLLPEN